MKTMVAPTSAMIISGSGTDGSLSSGRTLSRPRPVTKTNLVSGALRSNL